MADAAPDYDKLNAMLAALKAQEELAALRFEGDPEAAIAKVREMRRAAIAGAESAIKANAALIDALEDAREYFTVIVADCEGRFVPNEEMRILMVVESALKLARKS